MLNPILKFILLCVLSFSLFACSSSIRFSSKRSVRNLPETAGAKPEEKFDEYSNVKPLETVTGTASFYADKFHEKITYSGEVYDMYGISAAHPTYPMGTIVRITKMYDGKIIILKINDKMPQRPDRIIDLSLGTAQKLEMVNAGLAEIKLEVLKWGEGRK